jgi:hypothetical protein
MFNCFCCETLVLLGGVEDKGLRFCGKKCHRQTAPLLQAMDEVPASFLAEEIQSIHQGPCPECQGAGPVDMQTSHFIGSAIILTRWSSSPNLCCRKCALKSKLLSAAGSFVLGWWGVPWGILMTPVQVVRNLAGLFFLPSANPSPKLESQVRLVWAQKLLASQQQQAIAAKLAQSPALSGE